MSTRTIVILDKLHDLAGALVEGVPGVPAEVRRQALGLLFATADTLAGGVKPYEESHALEIVEEMKGWRTMAGLPPSEEIIEQLHDVAERLAVMGRNGGHRMSNFEAQTAIAALIIAAEALQPSVTEGEALEADRAIENMGKMALGEA